jgi:Tfp pilus assembly protein PilF
MTRAGHHREALLYLNKAVKLDPHDSDAYAKRAWVYNTLGEYRRALRDARKAIKLDPHNSDAEDAINWSLNQVGELYK